MLPYPSPRDLPDPGIELVSLMSPALAGRLFATRATWELLFTLAAAAAAAAKSLQPCPTLCDP